MKCVICNKEIDTTAYKFEKIEGNTCNICYRKIYYELCKANYEGKKHEQKRILKMIDEKIEACKNLIEIDNNGNLSKTCQEKINNLENLKQKI